eukprot:3912089-Amphidinium_carterae.1
MPTEYDTMLISTDLSDLEATAAGGILIERIQQEAAGMLQGSIILLADLGHAGLSIEDLRASISRSRLTVVILTVHTLECLQQVQVIIVGMLGKACVVPVVTPRRQHEESTLIPPCEEQMNDTVELISITVHHILIHSGAIYFSY